MIITNIKIPLIFENKICLQSILHHGGLIHIENTYLPGVLNVAIHFDYIPWH